MAVCPNCGEVNPDRARLCMMCGTALGEIQRTQTTERKIVSILFVDLVGFTARSHDADPEDVRASLGPYHALLKREIEHFGGSVEKFIGDAVMAVFGAPVAHEDDAERAVRAALRVTEAVAQLNEARPSLDLSVRAAVNTGEGLVTPETRSEVGEGMVVGDVVNTASRLQNVAPVNGVVVGEITYRSTKDFIDYQELEPVTVKGKPDPIAVWVALSARSRLGAAFEVAPKTPFVGRDHELDLVKSSFKRALRESTIQLVTVVGEPGVGKSRLLSEFSSFIDDQEELIFWRQGRSLPYGEGITFWALGEIIKAHAGILESDSSGQAASKLEAAVATAIGDSTEQQWFLSRLGPIVGVETAGTASPQKEESFTAWRRFLEAVAEDHPLVLAFEDLHWADHSLLEFIEHLVDWVSGVPIFVICTARPELYDKHPNWGGGKRNITNVSLSPLNDAETSLLISSLLSQAVLPPEVHTTLLEEAGGNPLYAEEFIRMLSDRGILKQQGKVFSLEKDADIPVPETVHALIAARVDTLSPELKSLLHDAAVAGKVFWSGAVAAIGQTNPQLVRQGLHELSGKEMVRASRTSSMRGEEEYSFYHALIRDVCYAQIPRAARSSKHAAIAGWIQEVSERLDDHAEVLAHHYSTALELAKASGTDHVGELEAQTRRFLIAAGDRALKLAPAKALALYRRALELLGPDDPETPRTLREAGIACEALGLLSEARNHLERAVAAFSARQDSTGEATALLALAYVYYTQGQADQSGALAVRAADLLEQHPPGNELAKAYTYVGYLELVERGPSKDALAWADKAYAAAHARRHESSTEGLLEALNLRGLVRSSLGDTRGLEDLREAIDLCEAAGNPGEAAGTYNNLADCIWRMDGPREGLEVNKRAQQLAHSHGHVHDARFSQGGALLFLFELGRWDELLEQAAELIAWSEEHGVTRVASWARLYTAFSLFHRGRLDEALSLEASYLSFFRATVELEPLAETLAFTALMHARVGESSVSLAMIQEFERRLKVTPPDRARHLPDVLRALALIGKSEQASRLLVPESDVYSVRDRHAVATAHAIVAEAMGEPEQACALYDQAALNWKEYGFVLEEGQALLGAGRCLLASRRTPEAASRLKDARAIFSRLGAVSLLEEAEGRLGQATAAAPKRTIHRQGFGTATTGSDRPAGT